MALNPKMQVVVTVEELESIKEAANARADELEWQLRLELARVREVERNLARLLGEASTTVVPERRPEPAPRPMPAATTPPPSVAKGSVAKPMPTPPPRHTPSIESIAIALAPPKPAAPTPAPAAALPAGATTRRPGQPPPLPPALRRAS
jgi:hypothetical protein